MHCPRRSESGRSWARNLLVVPRFSDLPEPLRRRVTWESDSLTKRTSTTAGAAFEAPQSRFRFLYDPLSSAAMRISLPRCDDRSSGEAAVLELNETGLGTALGVSELAGFLAALNRSVRADTSDPWRRGPIALSADRLGNRVEFPPHAVVPSQLAALSKLLRRDDLPAIYVAAVALVLITNCHPFTDGNGRVGRMMANAVLRRSGYTGYLPLHEFGLRSRGGLVVAQRRAEQLQDWAPICSYIWRSLDLAEKLAIPPRDDQPCLYGEAK